MKTKLIRSKLLAKILCLSLLALGAEEGMASTAEVLERVEVSGRRDQQQQYVVAVPSYNIPDGWTLPRETISGKRSSYERPAVLGNAPSLGLEDPGSNNQNPKTCVTPIGHLPIIYATGEKLLQHRDFFTGGLYGFDMTRTYRSNGATSGAVTSNKWYFGLLGPVVTAIPTYASGEPIVPTSVLLTEADGTTYTYRRKTPNTDPEVGYYRVGNSTAASATGEITMVLNQGISLVRNGITYNFNTNLDAKLTSVVDRGGVVLYRYTYSSGQVTITNAGGQSVVISVAAGNSMRVTAPDGQFWTYGYDSQNRLISVTPPTSGSGVLTYFYEDSSKPYAVTGYAIDGIRRTTYAYYANGQVQSSGLTNGEQSEAATYGTNQTTIVDQFGQSTIYSFAQVAGSTKSTSVSRPGTTSCGASSAATTYDANGYPSQIRDWNNIPTNYTYNAVGQIQAKTVAAGTSAAVTTAYTWSGLDIVSELTSDANGTAYRRLDWSFVQSGPPEFDTKSSKWLICIGRALWPATTTGTFERRGWVS